MKNLFKSRKLDLIGTFALFTTVLLMFNFASCQPNVASTTYYTVTFDANGGSEVSSQKIESGKTATLPDSTKTGYSLSGWYNGETVFDFSVPITRDLTLKAKWTAYTYTIVFDKNGGTGDDMQSLSCTYDEDVTLTMNSYTAPAGKVFVGWALSKDATTPVYSNGEIIKNVTSEDGAVITLYALYDTGYSVFYADGVNDAEITVPTDSTKYRAGSTVTVLFDGIGKRPGYNFVGWSDGENTYTSGGTTTFQMGTRNVTLTALWETNIKVSFSDDSINLLPLKSATIDVTVTNPDSLSLTFIVSSSSYNVSATWDSTNKQIKLENNLPYLFADKITITFENTTYGISKTLNVTSLVSDSDIDGTLTVNSAESTTLSDWTQLTYSAEKKVYIYKLNCSKANVAYRILNADTVSAIRSAMQSAGITVIDSKYYLFDSSSNEIAGVDDGVLSVTPEKSCTYYLVVYPYRYNNSNPTQYVGSTAIYTYSVSAITSLSLSENAVTLDAGGYIDIPVTYAGPEGYKTPSFTVTASGSNSTGSKPTSYSSGTMTDNGNGTGTLKIRAMNPGGSNTITLKDSVSGLTATCTVTVNLNTSSIDATISNIGSGTSTTLSDYTQGTFTNEKGSFVYSLALTSGKNYFFESSDSNTSILPSKEDSVFILYDADGAYLKTWDDSLTYVPTKNGTYYLVCRPYNASSNGNFAVHVYETKPITGLAFSQNTLSVNSGTTATLTATYTVPAGASPVFKVSSSADHGKSYRASASFTQNGSGSETITVYGALPGTATITLTDSVSLLSTQCTVTVSIDDSSATEISSSSIGNAASTTQSDWTQVALTSAGQASVYKISLEANKKYTFEIADSGCKPGMVNGTKVDAMFSLYDSSSAVISQLDGSSSDDKITVTPQSNTSYYFIVSPYDAGRTGAAAFHVYVSE